MSFRDILFRTLFVSPNELAPCLQKCSLSQCEHPLNLSFLMGKLLLSSSLLLSRLTAAAEKAHPGSWLNHPPLYIAALSHLSSILWSPSLYCVTVSLHSHLLCSLTLSLLSCSLYSCYNQPPSLHCSCSLHWWSKRPLRACLQSHLEDPLWGSSPSGKAQKKWAHYIIC